jgi:hypothetical protein
LSYPPSREAKNYGELKKASKQGAVIEAISLVRINAAIFLYRPVMTGIATVSNPIFFPI